MTDAANKTPWDINPADNEPEDAPADFSDLKEYTGPDVGNKIPWEPNNAADLSRGEKIAAEKARLIREGHPSRVAGTPWTVDELLDILAATNVDWADQLVAQVELRQANGDAVLRLVEQVDSLKARIEEKNALIEHMRQEWDAQLRRIYAEKPDVATVEKMRAFIVEAEAFFEEHYDGAPDSPHWVKDCGHLGEQARQVLGVSWESLHSRHSQNVKG